MRFDRLRLLFISVCFLLIPVAATQLSGSVADATEPRLRLIVETDAGGDPDDEQSLVRLLLYANQFNIEGIIANRPKAREGENRNPVRDGLGIVRAHINAYGKCYPNLLRHDDGFPEPDLLLSRTVAGYDDVDHGVQLIIRAVDADDPEPVWFSNWGTDNGAAESCLKRALDRVLRERGRDGYEKFKSRLRLSSADKFGEHTTNVAPPFPFWLNASHPPRDGKRWYHRFSALTATAGGFDIERDVRQDHGPLGQLYPVNTGLRQKEGDTMMFLYLLPTGMNDPLEPTWGSWGGRYGHNEGFPGKDYYWANQTDKWNGTTNRDNTVLRWAAALQNDFAARMDWCVADSFTKANHAPMATLNTDQSKRILQLHAKTGERVTFSAAGSIDPDGNSISVHWYVYPEPGSFRGQVILSSDNGTQTSFMAPSVDSMQTIHIVMEVIDNGIPALSSYRRAVVTVAP
ncbi:MAG: DUF1593 domain-containing protein [Planctomycetaceae bacterium]